MQWLRESCFQHHHPYTQRPLSSATERATVWPNWACYGHDTTLPPMDAHAVNLEAQQCGGAKCRCAPGRIRTGTMAESLLQSPISRCARTSPPSGVGWANDDAELAIKPTPLPLDPAITPSTIPQFRNTLHLLAPERPKAASLASRHVEPLL